MEILPVNDLDVALHNFVNKEDHRAFYNCLQYNLDETRVSSLSVNHIVILPHLTHFILWLILFGNVATLSLLILHITIRIC